MMPFVLIKGTFHVVGYSPDGDSLKFKAKRTGNWGKLSGGKVRKNQKGHVQLRFEGIDTLETHFKGTHQPDALAHAATDFTLNAAGIKNVTWGPKHSRVTGADDGVEGFILSRAAEKFGRPVSFVFAGTTSHQDGSEVFLDAALLRKSINYKLLPVGLAYPTYYEGLFSDLRKAMTAAVKDARSQRKGVWAVDMSSGITVNNLRSITDDHTILPKLFRRLVAYLKSHSSVSGFKQSMANNPEDVLILSRQHFTHFDTVITQNGKRIGLTVEPEDMVFRP